MFDPSGKTGAECSDFLFRWHAKRALARWRLEANAGSPEARALAWDVLAYLLDYEGRPHPYAVAQLGTSLRLSKTEAKDLAEVVRLARASLVAATA